MPSAKRKTDRRTLYTRKVIKQAVLDLLSEKDYFQITVTDICKRAELSRGTFYLHYENISQIVDELIEEVLEQTAPLYEHLEQQVSNTESFTFPLCQLLRRDRQYQALFLSDSLRERIVDRLSQHSHDGIAAAITSSGKFTEKELQALRVFQMNGCLAVCKQHIALPDEEWSDIQCSIDRLLQFGFQSS